MESKTGRWRPLVSVQTVRTTSSFYCPLSTLSGFRDYFLYDTEHPGKSGSHVSVKVNDSTSLKIIILFSKTWFFYCGRITCRLVQIVTYDWFLMKLFFMSDGLPALRKLVLGKQVAQRDSTTSTTLQKVKKTDALKHQWCFRSRLLYDWQIQRSQFFKMVCSYVCPKAQYLP